MPRDSSGIYTLAAGNPVVTGTIIESNWANTTMDDIAVALTDSLSRTGSGGMLVPFLAADGTTGNPSYSFLNGPTSGIWWDNASDEVVISVNTNTIVRYGAGGMIITGDMAITGTITGTGSMVYTHFLGDDGTAAEPTFAFTNNTNTGFYYVSPDEVRLSINGVDEAIWIPSNFTYNGHITAGGSLYGQRLETVGDSIIGGALDVVGDLDVGGGNFTVDAATGDSYIAGDLEVDGALTGAGGVPIADKFYPVGSIYMNANVATNPATLLGFGTWVPYAEGRVPVGKATSGTFGTAGASGGAENVTLTEAQMPAHMHDQIVGARNDSSSGGNPQAPNQVGNGDTLGTDVTNIQNAGSGAAHTNLQPYLVCYMWLRTV